MGAIEEFRQLPQDVIVPELKALTLRVEKLEEAVKDAYKHVEKRFDDADKRAGKRHEEVIECRTPTNRLQCSVTAGCPA